jgi:SOS-response transcriptional repressor LexA
MGWATPYIAKLSQGETVQVRPRGHSMRGRVESGQLCTIVPTPEVLEVGDIVLCKVHGREYLHLIKARQGDRYLIGNNRGRTNGWVSRHAIFGKCILVEGERA